ncbi:hypothetical protein STRDD10_00657 [Streptococcus sp. DD10]|nr:hypothetical protein STRDD10_00657 [Streptococcus sp. DD10]
MLEPTSTPLLIGDIISKFEIMTIIEQIIKEILFFILLPRYSYFETLFQDISCETIDQVV